jgi:hypothetical protein
VSAKGLSSACCEADKVRRPVQIEFAFVNVAVSKIVQQGLCRLSRLLLLQSLAPPLLLLLRENQLLLLLESGIVRRVRVCISPSIRRL